MQSVTWGPNELMTMATGFTFFFLGLVRMYQLWRHFWPAAFHPDGALYLHYFPLVSLTRFVLCIHRHSWVLTKGSLVACSLIAESLLYCGISEQSFWITFVLFLSCPISPLLLVPVLASRVGGGMGILWALDLGPAGSLTLWDTEAGQDKGF